MKAICITEYIEDAQHIQRLTADESRWVPARSVNWSNHSPWMRLRMAWLVFRGDADAVSFPEQGREVVS